MNASYDVGNARFLKRASVHFEHPEGLTEYSLKALLNALLSSTLSLLGHYTPDRRQALNFIYFIVTRSDMVSRPLISLK